MKKSLIALAVLAASGASFAQSSVTAYGLRDIWVGTVKAGGVRTTVLESGGVNESRWGLKGSEDLGGGLKANFKLEQGFRLDSGAATSGQAFSRYAYVGFSGGFGEVKLGKTGTAYDDVQWVSDAVFDSALAPMNNVFASTPASPSNPAGYTWNPSNTIYYATPSISGFSGAFSYSLDEKVAATPKISSVNVAYAGGPLALQFGYQKEDLTNVSNDTSFLRLGGSFNFGVATAKATYGEVKNVGNVADAKTKDWQLGVDVPVGPALTLSASYAQSDENAKAGDTTGKGWGFAGAYTLSKRTYLYGGFTSNKYTTPRLADSKLEIFALGVNHKF